MGGGLSAAPLPLSSANVLTFGRRRNVARVVRSGDDRMTEPAKRRGRGWKILGIVVGGIVLCLGALAIWVSAVAGRRMAELDAKTHARVVEWKGRPAARP